MKSLPDKVNAKLNAQGGFLKALSILVGGTAFAQLISLLCLPIITRLYSPDDFAIFSVYLAFVSILAVGACLRFEIAITTQENDQDAVALVVLAVICNIFYTAIITIILLLLGETILKIFNKIELLKYLWAIPLGVFLSGLYSSLQFWNVRRKKYALLAKTRLVQSVSSSSVQILSGFLGVGSVGLIYGQLFNFIGGGISLISIFLKENKKKLTRLTTHNLKKIFIKNKNYPKYSLIEGLLSSISIHLPMIIIFLTVSAERTGYLMLAMKVMAIPLMLIGSAISQIYLADAKNKSLKGDLFDFTYSIIKKVIVLGVMPLILIGISSPYLFPLIFGIKWAGSGSIVLLLLPWFAFQLLTSPVSMALHVLDKQRIAMYLHIFGFLLRIIGLLIFSKVYPEFSIEYFAFSSCVFYILFFLVIMYFVKSNKRMVL
ncbi:lipopolysaccharide biosynthesis protein [Acinetobacter chinensis]|uniref:lipopolysaccharide biosynthesis protein n=1 Tax=Acinetobacter chinensis TaxID=2004650 RepID=UPI002934B355|nr:oligosaccharide flippase family protein [Acinetobacter chinensis]WOE41671.1 oligosaccharide flippase family protein [Acinetobacter chinensis]